MEITMNHLFLYNTNHLFGFHNLFKGPCFWGRAHRSSSWGLEQKTLSFCETTAHARAQWLHWWMQPLPRLGLEALSREWTAKLNDVTGLWSQQSAVIYAICWLMLRFAVSTCCGSHSYMWRYDEAETPRQGLAYASFPQIPVMRERAQQLYLSKAKGASELNKETQWERWNKASVNDERHGVAGGCVRC